jgi:carboxylesterase
MSTKLCNNPFTLLGVGVPILFIHGLGGGVYELQWLAQELNERTGRPVLVIRLPGHEPARRMPNQTYPKWIGAIEEELTAIGSDMVDIVGFSAGAILALSLATGRFAYQVRSLVLLAPLVRIYRPKFLPVKTERVLQIGVKFLREVNRKKPPLQDPNLRTEVQRLLPFPNMNLLVVQDVCRLVQDVLSRLKYIESPPTLILQGAKDTVVDPKGVYTLTKLIKDYKLVLLPRSNHLLVLDKERHKVFGIVEEFLRKV